MSISQRLCLSRQDPHRDAPPERTRLLGTSSGLVAFAALILGAMPVCARAQDRAELQVAAQVLSTTPSLEALDLATPPVDGSERWDTSLATIEVDRLVFSTVADSLADRPRAVVVVSFLRN
jgi:hypothetical protein